MTTSRPTSDLKKEKKSILRQAGCAFEYINGIVKEMNYANKFQKLFWADRTQHM
jgi:hypothetical protein